MKEKSRLEHAFDFHVALDKQAGLESPSDRWPADVREAYLLAKKQAGALAKTPARRKRS